MQSQTTIEWDGQKTWAFLCIPMRFMGVSPTLRVCYDSAVLVARSEAVNYFVGFAVEEPVVFGILPMELGNRGFVVPDDSPEKWTKNEKIATISNGIYEATIYKATSHDGRPGIWLWDGKRERVYPLLFVEA